MARVSICRHASYLEQRKAHSEMRAQLPAVEEATTGFDPHLTAKERLKHLERLQQ